MIGELTTGVSWLGVVLGAVASFLMGWLWYSPILFGAKWAEGTGVPLGTAADMPFGAMAAQAAGLLLLSWFVGVAVASGMVPAASLATIAFTVMAYSTSLFGKKSLYARNVDAGYVLICFVVMVACQAIF